MVVRPIAALFLAATVAQSVVPTSVAAQQVSSSSPAAACTKAANDYRTEQTAPALAAYRKATDSTRADLTKKYIAAINAAAAGAQKMAADCAAKFNVARVPPAQLMDLITLYGVARDTMNGRLATERLLTAKDLPPRARGQALVLAMQQEVTKASSYFGILEGAEGYVKQIDMLPDSLADIKLAAHRSMLYRYDYLDVAEGLRSHATAVIALARKLERPDDIVAGYALLARSYADRLQPDSALTILDGAEKELGAPATKAFADFRGRYALIGTPASEISAQWWINTDAKTVVTPARGKVTLVEFTAHWCGPCKNSYPGLRALAEHLKGKDFTGVMVTQLYGYIGTQRDLTAEQEVAADRNYFGTEHALPFPVAINQQVKPTAVGVYVQPKPDTDYRVSGIPQIILIDKRGIIRQIVTGWDQGNTERFSKYIDQLLNERVAVP
jgi:thiol-disulfide isomerase/thioredoxin